MSSLISIQKPRSKRAIIPKASLIQVFIDSSPLSEPTKSRILPKINDQNLIKQFNLIPQQSSDDNMKSIRNSLSNQVKSPSNPLKKTIKDNKFKQITRLCLYQSEQAQNHEKNYLNCLNDDKNNLNDTLEDLNQLSVNQYRNKQNLLKHVSFIIIQFF